MNGMNVIKVNGVLTTDEHRFSQIKSKEINGKGK
jgi:hypothetical protein